MTEETLIIAAINEYAAGNLDAAEAQFRQIQKMNPNTAAPFYFLGLIAMDKGVRDQATQLLYHATLLEPKNKDYQYSLAVALQEEGKYTEAIALYEKLTDMPESQNNLGNIYRTLGQLDKSRNAFDKALELNPKMVWALVNKALLERQENHPQKALKLLQDALTFQPDFIQGLYQLSIQERLNNNFNKALQHIEKSINLNNSVDFLWVEYGKVLKALERPKDALIAFERAIGLNRFSADAYFEKAMLQEAQNPTEAEQAYRDILRIAPDNTAAYNNLGALLYRQGRLMEALEMYRQVFIMTPEDPITAFNLAVALEDTADYEEAAGLYFKILGQKMGTKEIVSSEHTDTKLPHGYVEPVGNNTENTNDELNLENEVHIRLANLLPAWFGKNEKQALIYAQGWVKNFPDNPLARHTFDALKGNTPNEDVDFSYTQTFYDAFSDSYEDKMKVLKCHIPDLIAQEIKGKHFKNALDLGCGTGLSGCAVKKNVDVLSGVEASVKMIEKAREKAIYQSLYTQDILDFLTHASEQFDLIIAADVFCYINKLYDIFKEVHKVLSSTGIFIFTVEKANADDAIRLQTTGRYQHGRQVVEAALTKVGFNQINVREVTLREENKSPCLGYLFIVQK